MDRNSRGYCDNAIIVIYNLDRAYFLWRISPNIPSTGGTPSPPGIPLCIRAPMLRVTVTQVTEVGGGVARFFFAVTEIGEALP